MNVYLMILISIIYLENYFKLKNHTSSISRKEPKLSYNIGHLGRRTIILGD